MKLTGKWIEKTSARGYPFRVYRLHWLIRLRDNLRETVRRLRARTKGYDENAVVLDYNNHD